MYQLKIKIKTVNSELQPEIRKSEIMNALKEIKNNKAPGKDRITMEKWLLILLSRILKEMAGMNLYQSSYIIHNKRNRIDLKPSTHNTLLLQLLKKILTSRLTTKFEGYLNENLTSERI